MHLSNSAYNRVYARFIPSEEVGDVTQWKFGAVDGSGVVHPEPVPELPAQIVDEELLAQQEADQLAAIQRANDEGYAEGLAHGRAEAALEWQQRMDEYIAGQGREVAQRLEGVMQSLEGSLAEMQQAMSQQLLDLGCDIARQVVRQELTINPNVLQPVVREAVGLLVAEGRPATVRLNPADLETVAQPLREAVDAPGVQWIADATVAPGGCLVESAGTVVDGSIDKRWQRAVAALGLQSPWESGVEPAAERVGQ
jgi:flagellar assembly protein FliH